LSIPGDEYSTEAHPDTIAAKNAAPTATTHDNVL